MLFKKILDEHTVEINKSPKDVIEKLRMLKSDLRSSDSIGDNLIFICNKKGKIKIRAYEFTNKLFHRTYPLLKLYKITGEVLSENGKTKIKIYHCYNYLTNPFRCLFLVWSYLNLLWSVIKTPFPGAVFSALLMAALVTAFIAYQSYSESHNKTTIWENTKKEIEQRVEAVKRWDD